MERAISINAALGIAADIATNRNGNAVVLVRFPQSGDTEYAATERYNKVDVDAGWERLYEVKSFA